MKKENLGRNIICGVILLIIIVLGIVIYVNNSNTDNELTNKNETNIVVNETEEDIPEDEPITLVPENTVQTGVGE